MPSPRYFPAGCALNGVFYVIGGNGAWGEPPIDVVEAYDPKTDTWAAKKKLTSPQTFVTACALDGIIYAIGGYDGSLTAKVEAFDPTTDQWTRKANMPSPGCRGVATVAGGMIYAFFDRNIFVYDPKTDRWTKARIPWWTLNSGASVAGVADGIIYLFGGLESDDSISYSCTLAYDSALTNFTPKRLMPATLEGASRDGRRAYAACATIDGKMYIAGGISANPNHEPGAVGYRSTWMFDPQGGVAPQIIRFTIEGTNSVRLSWQAEVGRLYGIHHGLSPRAGIWSPLNFSTGTNSIVATREIMEATCTVPTTGSWKFFRVVEAD